MVHSSNYIALLFCLKGVGTTIKKASYSSGCRDTLKKPFSTTCFSTFCKSGSPICIAFFLIISTNSRSTSTPPIEIHFITAIADVGRSMYPNHIKTAMISYL